jgi:hypothetical protein
MNEGKESDARETGLKSPTLRPTNGSRLKTCRECSFTFLPKGKRVEDNQLCGNCKPLALTSTARPQAGSYAAVVRGGRDGNIPARSTLVVKIDQMDRDQPIDAKLMDNLLDSKNKVPVAQQVSRKEDKLYVTFADAVESARAQTIMESKAECKAIFKPIGTQERMYPLIGK